MEVVTYADVGAVLFDCSESVSRTPNNNNAASNISPCSSEHTSATYEVEGETRVSTAGDRVPTVPAPT